MKAIDRQAQRPVDLAELIIGLHSHQASTAHRLAYHGSILLLNMALVVLDPWAPTCKSQVFLFTIREQFLIEELRAAIGVNASKGNGKSVRAYESAASTASALFSNRGMHSVQPMARSVSVRVYRNFPSRWSPQ